MDQGRSRRQAVRRRILEVDGHKPSESQPAQVKLTLDTDIEFRRWRIVPIAAACVVAFVAAYLLFVIF